MRDTEPLQHRLAYSGSDGMTVSWSTFAHIKEPTVWCKAPPLLLFFRSNCLRIGADMATVMHRRRVSEPARHEGQEL